jgi:integrase
MEESIHNYKRRLENTYKRVMSYDNISADNKALITKFRNNCIADGLSISKLDRYIFDIGMYARMLKKPLLEATKEDIKAIIAEVEQKEWSPHTKHSFKITLRKFYKSIEGPEEKGVYPERIRWLHSNVKNNQIKRPSDMVSEEEAMEMINCCRNARDKAFIAVLFESGCRISEVGHMKVGDMSFDQYGAIISVSGKTGTRNIRLVLSAPYLQEYINKFERNNEPTSFIWTKRDFKLLGYSRFGDILSRAAKRAGIKKRIYPHLFRHSRATFLARHLTESQMKQYLGWTQSSKMAGIYVHLSGRDTEEAILALNGIKTKEKNELKEELKPRKCAKCYKINAATVRFCDNCGMILDGIEASKIIQKEIDREKADKLMNKLIEDPEILELIKKKLT